MMVNSYHGLYLLVVRKQSLAQVYQMVEELVNENEISFGLDTFALDERIHEIL